MSITLLVGHTSQETAYHQDDYPYSFNLRCQRRAWLEYRPKHGYRAVTQTSNPKRPGLAWNKPHAGTYHPLVVMYLDDRTGHVEWDSLNLYAELARVEQFATAYEGALQGEREASILGGIRKIAVVGAERKQCQARMRELAEQPAQGPGAMIVKTFSLGVRYMSSSYSFWAAEPANAFVFPHALAAAGLILACPHALGDATVQVRPIEEVSA